MKHLDNNHLIADEIVASQTIVYSRMSEPIAVAENINLKMSH